MVCSNLKIGTDPFSEKTMVFCQKTDRKYTFDFNTSSERPLSKLSENNKLTNGTKLWLFKDALKTI